MLIPGLKNIVKMAAGNNHFLALTSKGAVLAWGAGEHNQLGRRIVERTRLNGLVPREFGLPKGITDIAAGSEHSFALHKNGTVFSWGANNYGQCGQFDNAGGNEAVTGTPAVVKSLKGKNIKMLAGGNGHSLAVTEEGEVLVWGRATSGTSGLDLEKLSEEDVILDGMGKRAIVKVPIAMPFKGSFVACGGEHSIVLGADGTHHSWGFNTYRQTGLEEEDDVHVAMQLSNKHIDGKKLVWAGAGGQFSYIAGIAGVEA